MAAGTVHVIGAGLAGLSAATRLCERGRRVIIHEASGQAGGRCRSYHDASFGGMIDNGNHLLLSGNHTTLSYLKRIGSSFPPQEKNPVFAFADAATGERWQLRLNPGRLPFWLFDRNRRIPGTRAREYFSILRLLRARKHQTVSELLPSGGAVYRRLWHPLLLSALNLAPEYASARLAASVLRGTLLKGGKACVPLVAEHLSSAFIEPALKYVEARGGSIKFHHRLQRIRLEESHAAALDFGASGEMPLAKNDAVICAVPPWIAASLLPEISAPDEYRGILNAHFRIPPPPNLPRILGVMNATVEWIFAFPDRISITVSDADRLMAENRETLAERLWKEVVAVAGLTAPLPPWQIVKEKRATFASTPAEDARRPETRTPWRNVALAGDWVQTGLPATIESAALSGERAAMHIMESA